MPSKRKHLEQHVSRRLRSRGNIEPSPQVSIFGEPGHAQRLNADLLRRDGTRVLVAGIDFGTSNTSAVWVVLDKHGQKDLNFISNVQALRTQGDQVRLPTLVALQPEDNDNSARIGRLLFASDASQALGSGLIRETDMFEFSKLALKASDTGIIRSDREELATLKTRLNSISDLCKRYDVIKAVYPDAPEQEFVVEVTSVKDLIQQILRYFLGLLKSEIGLALGFSMEEVQHIFDLENIEAGFAAPCIWSDLDICNFVTLIEKAGWPSKVKVWNEAKAAAIAHIARDYINAGQDRRTELRDYYTNRAVILGDIGGGTFDITTIMAAEINQKTIKFATVAESSGSLDGGHKLDELMAREIEQILGENISDVKSKVSHESAPLNNADFLRAFDYQECRKDFNNVKKTHVIRYDGEVLPAGEYPGLLTTKGVVLKRSVTY